MTPRVVTDVSPEVVTDVSPKDSHSEDSQVEEKNIDLDYPPGNRKKRDSRSDDRADIGGIRQYPRLREAMADYMAIDDKRSDPSDRIVVDVMHAAGGAAEGEVIDCLRYLKKERGLRPGTKHGPKRWGWFKTVVGDYFKQKTAREMVFSQGKACRLQEGGLDPAEFDSMTDAF
jgi:hypothetical protein